MLNQVLLIISMCNTHANYRHLDYVKL